MVFVPISLDHLRQLGPGRIAVFDYSSNLIPLIRDAGFGLVIVEGHGVKKIIAVSNNKGDLVGKARAWNLPHTSHLDFEPESATTRGGWFAQFAAYRSR